MRLTRLAAALVVLALVAAACGDDAEPQTSDPAGSSTSTSAPPGDSVVPVALAVSERETPGADPALAGSAITAFGFDVFASLRETDPEANVVASPASIAIALAMVEPGASGDALQQLHDVLRIDDPAAWHASLNALEQDLEQREPEAFNDDDEPGDLIVRIANAAYLQTGYPFEAPYLDAIGRHYGPVLHEVDFEPDPDAVAHAINDFIADATNGQITEPIADGVIDPATVLALVNALYFKGSWLEPFDAEATEDGAFTRLDGSEITVPMMTGESSSSMQGDGWVGASKSYGGDLAVQFILPDEDRFEEIAADPGAAFDAYVGSHGTRAALVLPRFETRYQTELTDALQALGLVAPYNQGGLLGIADDPRLIIDKVIHESFVAMDEEGTEASAATIILAFPTSAGGPPVDVELDRPFLFRIVDTASNATLFIGQIADPTA